MPTELKQKARELFAAEYRADGFCNFADEVLTRPFELLNRDEKRALRAIVAALQAQQPDESAWREGWAFAYSGIANLYRDDGELHDCSAFPAIDWRKDSAQEIRAKIRERGAAKLAEGSQQPGAQAVAAWPNGCDKTVPKALRYLADHDRPGGGCELYNTEHLLQLAEEIEQVAGMKAQPPSIPEPSEDDWRAARDVFNATIMTAPGNCDAIREAAWLAALTTYTARLRERIGHAPGGDGDA